MSGWDATSRPTWDPPSGTGENTQSFGVPELADDGGFPSSAPPGTPPDIFLQDYANNDFASGGFEQVGFGQTEYPRGDVPQGHLGQNDFGQNDFGQNDFGQNDFGAALPGHGDFGLSNDFAQNNPGRGDFGQTDFGQTDFGQTDFGQTDFGQTDFGQTDFGQTDFGGQNDFGQNDFRQTDFGGQNDFGHDDFRRSDFGQQDRGGRGFRDEDPAPRGYDQRGSGTGDFAQQDFPRRDRREDFERQPGAGTDRDYAARGFPDADRADPPADPDSDSAARMDPALRDFFAPQSARQDSPPQGYGQPRHGTRGYPGQGGAGQPAAQGQGQGQGQGQAQRQGQRQGQGRGPGGQFGPGLSNGHRQPGPGGGFQGGGQRGRWDTGAQRPGSRTARRQESQADRRGLAPAVVAIGLVVVLGIAIGAYMLLSGNSTPKASGTAPTAAPTATSSKSTSKGTSKTQLRPAAATVYTLKTPATAGGYARLASTPSGVQTAASATSLAIKTKVTSGGAKVTSQVTAAYQLSSGQVLAFTGFEGTFNPTKVMAALATFGTDSHPAAAGPHGGMLACATTPSPNGTVCVWVTTTTMGITEFFASSNLPEVVTVQAKAASDTLKFRASVEAPKP